MKRITSQPPGPSIEPAGRAPPPAGKEGITCVLLDRAGLELRGWPAPARHTRLRMTEGLRCALARLGQPDQLPWSPSGRSWGSRIRGTRSRSWPSGAARLRRAAAAWSQRYDQLLRIFGTPRGRGCRWNGGSLGYQTGMSEPPSGEFGPETYPEWLITKQTLGSAALWRAQTEHARRVPPSWRGLLRADLVCAVLITPFHVVTRNRLPRARSRIDAA
jgi:hypothetical protein